MDDRVSALIHTVSIQGAAYQISCNKHFADVFMTPEEFYLKMHNESVSPIFIFTG